MAKRRSVELHDFYCLKCGNKSFGCFRKSGFQHEKFHRKKLYCIYCRTEVNHVECKTYEDVQEFKEAFNEGKFIEEAEESVRFVNEA